MSELELANQITYVQALLTKSRLEGSLRLERQYIMALFHLQNTLLEIILKQDCFQKVA